MKLAEMQHAFRKAYEVQHVTFKDGLECFPGCTEGLYFVYIQLIFHLTGHSLQLWLARKFVFSIKF